MGRRPCCAKEEVNRGAWSVKEDKILIDYIQSHGEGKWRDLPHRAGLSRCGKSCRLRWMNYLRPNIKRGNISEEEEDLIIRLHKLLGNRWALIAGRLPGRTDNEIKNYWNTNLSKRLQEKEIQQFGKQTTSESRQDRLAGNNSTVPRETTQVIRTKAVRCMKVVFPPQPEIEEGHGIRTVPMSNENPPSSSLWPNDDNDNSFLLDFDISDLLVPDVPMSSSEPLVHVDKSINDHQDTTYSNSQFDDVPHHPPSVAARRFVGDEQFDPNSETFNFSALSSFLSGDDDEVFA